MTAREGQQENHESHKLQTRLHGPGAKHVCWYRWNVCVCFRRPSKCGGTWRWPVCW